MIVVRRNLWDLAGTAVLCVTTNGFVNRAGAAVMGRGCAREARDRFPGIDLALGAAIRANGSRVQAIWAEPLIVAFPVKPTSAACADPARDVVSHLAARFRAGDVVPGWACKADLAVIERSAAELAEAADRAGWTSVAVPMPGCGAGELSWALVEPVLDRHLDRRFFCVTR